MIREYLIWALTFNSNSNNIISYSPETHKEYDHPNVDKDKVDGCHRQTVDKPGCVSHGRLGEALGYPQTEGNITQPHENANRYTIIQVKEEYTAQLDVSQIVNDEMWNEYG